MGINKTGTLRQFVCQVKHMSCTHTCLETTCMNKLTNISLEIKIMKKESS